MSVLTVSGGCGGVGGGGSMLVPAVPGGGIDALAGLDLGVMFFGGAAPELSGSLALFGGGAAVAAAAALPVSVSGGGAAAGATVGGWLEPQLVPEPASTAAAAAATMPLWPTQQQHASSAAANKEAALGLVHKLGGRPSAASHAWDWELPAVAAAPATAASDMLLPPPALHWSAMFGAAAAATPAAAVATAVAETENQAPLAAALELLAPALLPATAQEAAVSRRRPRAAAQRAQERFSAMELNGCSSEDNIDAGSQGDDSDGDAFYALPASDEVIASSTDEMAAFLPLASVSSGMSLAAAPARSAKRTRLSTSPEAMAAAAAAATTTTSAAGKKATRQRRAPQRLPTSRDAALRAEEEARAAGVTLYYCPEAGCPWNLHGYLDAGSLRKHKSRDHSGRSYPCGVDSCQLVFKTPSELHNHQQRKHLLVAGDATIAVSTTAAAAGSAELPFPCTICNQFAYAVKSSLTAHIKRAHSHQLDFGCDLCDARFAYKGDLTQHLRRKHNQATDSGAAASAAIAAAVAKRDEE